MNLSQVQEERSLAVAECIKDSFKMFDICYKRANDEIHPSFFSYIEPFLPAALLVWISWVFKIKIQLNIDAPPKILEKIIVTIIYLVGALGFALPFFIVFEKEVDRLYAVSLQNLFLMPWLAVSWLSIPLFFQKLVHSEVRMLEISKVRLVIYAVAASPLLATISILVRQELKI